MTSLRTTLSIATLLGLATPAAAHIALTYPAARTTEQKDGDCGAAPGEAGEVRGTVTTTIAPGATIEVTWNETVDHVGHFRISFNADGDSFEYPVTGDEAFAATLVDDIGDRAGGGGYAQTITLPDVECDDCTLQLIQVMSASPPFVESNFYYQCADLVLSADAGGDQGGGGDDEIVEEPSGGCAAGGPTGATAALLVALALAARRRLSPARRMR